LPHGSGGWEQNRNSHCGDLAYVRGRGGGRGRGKSRGRGRGVGGRGGAADQPQGGHCTPQVPGTQAAGSRLLSSFLHHRGRGSVQGGGQGRGRGGGRSQSHQPLSRSAALAGDLVMGAVDAARLTPAAAYPVHPRVASLKVLTAAGTGLTGVQRHNSQCDQAPDTRHDVSLQHGMIPVSGHNSVQQQGVLPAPLFPAWEPVPVLPGDHLQGQMPLSNLFAPIQPGSAADAGEEEEVQLLARPANLCPAVDDAERQEGGLAALH
jgi:hypothetical protein